MCSRSTCRACAAAVRLAGGRDERCTHDPSRAKGARRRCACRRALDLPAVRAATAAPTGRAGWCARTTLTVDDLIWPLFLIDGDKRTRAGRLHAGRRAAVDRRGGRGAGERAASSASRPSPLFPYTDPQLRDAGRRGGAEPGQPRLPGGPGHQARASPRSASITDVALDPYTSHGQDGLLRRRLRSSTTRPSRCWSARRWCRPRPAPT